MSFGKQHLINELFRFVALLENSGDFIFAPVGLTVKTYAVLSLISRGIDTSGELLAGTYGSKPNMAKKLRSLEENGFIDRSIDTHDKRIYHFQLTEKSIKALAEITPIYENALEDIFEGISSSEIEMAHHILAKSGNKLATILTETKACREINAREVG